MPRVKGSGETCAAYSAEPKCKGCISKRPCHRKPTNRLAGCSCGHCESLAMQVPVDKGDGQLEQSSIRRCSRSQMNSNSITNHIFTLEKGPKYQTAAAKEKARRCRKKRQKKYQNSKAPKKSEGTQPHYTNLVFVFLSIFLSVFCYYCFFVLVSSFHSNLGFVTMLMNFSS